MPTFKSPYTIPHDHKQGDITGLTQWQAAIEKSLSDKTEEIIALRERVTQLTCAVVVLVLFAATVALLVLVNS